MLDTPFDLGRNGSLDGSLPLPPLEVPFPGEIFQTINNRSRCF